MAVAAQEVTMEETFWTGASEVWTFATPITSPPEKQQNLLESTRT